MTVPLPSEIVAAPEPLILMPVTASQFAEAEMPVTVTWACTGAAADQTRQVASIAKSLRLPVKNQGAAKLHNLSMSAGGKRMSRLRQRK